MNNYRHSDNKCNLVIIIDLIFYSFCPDLIVFARLKSLSLVQQVKLGKDKKTYLGKKSIKLFTAAGTDLIKEIQHGGIT